VTEHFARGAELLAASEAIVALPAGDEVVEAHGVADAVVERVLADFHDLAGDFMPEREGEWIDARPAGPIMHIGVTDAGGANAHEDVAGTARGHRDFGVFDAVTRSGETDSAHGQP